jgi:enamine deaminase RidA (YjgF/YER057c/UK114 family)
MGKQQLISSGSKWEPVIGYSRAVRAGNTVYVSGTVGVNPDGGAPDGAYAQTRRALEIIKAALEKAGAKIEDVVRTRVFLADIKDFDDAGKAHGEVFSEIRPALTMLAAGALVGGFLVEVEAVAVIP